MHTFTYELRHEEYRQISDIGRHVQNVGDTLETLSWKRSRAAEVMVDTFFITTHMTASLHLCVVRLPAYLEDIREDDSYIHMQETLRGSRREHSNVRKSV